MIRSMTGYGTAEGTVGRTRVSIDVRSVNHRFFNVTIKLPPELSRWESDVRETLRQLIGRGHVTLTARYERSGEVAASVDEARFAANAELLKALRDKYGLGGDIDLATVLRLPDVITQVTEPSPDDAAEFTKLVRTAAESLCAAREREGRKLVEDIIGRLGTIERAMARVGERAPQRVLEHRERLREAIRQLADGIAVDEQRLAQEIAVMADRHDVQEELARFAVHLEAFRRALNGHGSDGVGKRLGFLLQEMLREANTTASKANDAAMQGEVVTIKEELERVREQVENLE